MEEGPPAPGLMPVRGSAPDPAGAAPLRPALKSKTFLKGENTLPKMLANLTPLPPPKSQIRKEALRRSFAPPSGSSFDYKMLIRKQGYVEDNRHLRNDAGNLAAFLYGLKQRKLAYYRRIVEAIRQVAPFFDDFVLVPKAETEQRSILLNWKDRDSEHLFGPHQLSDGTLRTMALITLLLQPEDGLPALIVLD